MAEKIDRVLKTDEFEDFLDLEFQRATRYNLYFSLLIAEFNIKYADQERINRRAGKEIVRKVLRLVEKDVRGSDVLGYDGENRLFILLLEAGDDTALIVGERLRRLIHEYSSAYGEGVEFSIGGARFPSDENDKDSLITKAQVLLDQAIEQGGNLVLLSNHK